jgi:hypothetical protein
MEELRDKALSFLTNKGVYSTIAYLIENEEKLSKEEKQIITAIKIRNNSLRKKKLKGILSYEEEVRQENEIADSLLIFLDGSLAGKRTGLNLLRDASQRVLSLFQKSKVDYDDFSNGSKNWNLGVVYGSDHPKGAIEVAGNQLVIINYLEIGIIEAYKKIKFSKFSNFRIQTQMVINTPNGDAGCALIWGGISGRTNIFAFGLNPSGSFYIYNMPNNRYIPLVNKMHDAINIGGNPNQLTVLKNDLDRRCCMAPKRLINLSLFF